MIRYYKTRENTGVDPFFLFEAGKNSSTMYCTKDKNILEINKGHADFRESYGHIRIQENEFIYYMNKFSIKPRGNKLNTLKNRIIAAF